MCNERDRYLTERFWVMGGGTGGVEINRRGIMKHSKREGNAPLGANHRDNIQRVIIIRKFKGENRQSVFQLIFLYVLKLKIS